MRIKKNTPKQEITSRMEVEKKSNYRLKLIG